MKHIKITLLKNKRFEAENKEDVSVQENENNATIVEVEFPSDYENFSKRVDFQNRRNEKWSIGLYQPEDTRIEYADNFDKLHFSFTVPRPMAIRGEMKMQFVAYLTDDSNTVVPFHIVVITINESILYDGSEGEDEPDLILKAYEYSNYALDKSSEALERSINAERAALESEASAKKAEQSAKSVETKVSEANASAKSAQESATSANTRAINAEQSSAESAESARQSAESSASAQTSATNAQNSAKSAQQSATSSQASAKSAETSASNSSASAKSAQDSATKAETSAKNAETSASSAQASATSANSRATNAETSARNAEESARQSAESASSADVRASNAESVSETANSNSISAVSTANDANTKSTKALAIVNGLQVSSEEIDCEEHISVEMQTNSSTSMKNIHFKVPAPKKGTSYRHKGAWSSSATYINDQYYIDTVSRHGATYYCKQTNTNQGPVAGVENEYWGILAEKGSDAGVTIVDNLDSEHADYVLSAKQGNVLKELIASSVETAITNLINGSPDNLNTLKELASAIGNDASFSTTIKGLIQTNTNNIATNKTNIATNKTNISTNASGISTNKSNITKLTNNTTVIANSNGGFAAGSSAVANASGAVQLGGGTNSTANTLQFKGYQLVDSAGKIPKERLLDTVYPVGSIYMSVNSTNPQTLFGGTWTQLQDRFLLGAGSTYTNGATGGSKDAVAVSHEHTITQNVGGTLAYGNWGAIYGNGYESAPGSTSGNIVLEEHYNSYVGKWAGGGDKQRGRNVYARYRIPDLALASAGESGVDKNMPPYLVVYMWKRVS